MKSKKILKTFLKSFLFILLIVFVISIIIACIYYFSLDEFTRGFFSIKDLIIDIALGIISAILSLFLFVIKPFIQVIITVLQNIIYILTLYPILQSFFKINPFWITITFGGFFLILLIFFFILSWFQRIHSDQKENFKWLNIGKAIIVFLFAPITLVLLTSFLQLFIYVVFDKDIFTLSFYKIIEDITLNNDSIMLVDLNAPEVVIYFFKIVLFLFCSFLSIWFLWIFTYNLVMRFFEIIWFGSVGITISSSTIVFDEGERFYMWIYIMLQKIAIPIIGVLSYLFYLMIMPSIINLINELNPNFFVLGFEWESKAILEVLFIIMGCALMESLISEWTFIISGKNGRSAFATQMDAGNFITRPLLKGLSFLRGTKFPSFGGNSWKEIDDNNFLNTNNEKIKIKVIEHEKKLDGE